MAALPDVPRQLVYDSGTGPVETRAFREWLDLLRRMIAAGGGGGTGTVTNIGTTAPITGGPITTTGTIGVTDFAASGVSHARGTVPDPGAVAGSTKFLREDATWATPPGGATSPLTTKGDIWGFSTLDARLPVGSDGKVLTADSTAPLGVSYQTPSTGIAGITVKDEGTTVGTAAGITSANFVGAPVVATGVGAAATITVSTISTPSTFDWGKFIAGTHCWPAG